MKTRRHAKTYIATLVASAFAAGMLITNPAMADISSATVRGQITSDGTAQAGTEVIAINQNDGRTYRAVTRADGSYVLPSVAPGEYVIQVSGAGGQKKSDVISLHVGETASLDLSLPSANSLDKVTVVGTAQRADVRTSDVGTNVSRAQIENLPQITRNFLSFADLAPGVRFNVDGGGYTKMQSGAQSSDNVNIFIDGVGQKNYVLKGGVSGQDTSRGNPFPQSAIAEYKVISQNYKAEFDQVSSAAITAVTKSGTNEFHGDVFWDFTNQAMTSKSPFQKKDEAAGIKRPDFSQNQYGVSIGGPIVLDRMHFFISYEGKDNTNPRQFSLHNTDGMTNIPSFLTALAGSESLKFKEDLLFAKLSAQISDSQRVDVTAKFRDEKDTVPEDAGIGGIGFNKNRKNNETRFDATHEYNAGPILNEARVAYELSYWKPQTLCTDRDFIEYKRSNWSDIVWGGCSPDSQNKEQTGFLIEDNLTYTGLAAHTFKTGAKMKDLTFKLDGTLPAVNHGYVFVADDGSIDLQGQPSSPFYAPWLVQRQPLTEAKYKNQQFGIYFQDDWELTSQLELNMGVRWDYETNMLNNDYVTPAHIVTDLNALDTRAGAAPGQTYAQSLAIGGININNYISNGSSRKPFKGAIQPRFGFSYDVTGDKSTVFFAGAGRAYDRTMANHALDELFHNLSSNGEIWLIKNNMKMPYTDQFSLGLRQQLGIWNGEIGATKSSGHNGFIWFSGNRAPDGSLGSSPIDPLWGGAPGHGNLLLGDFVTRTETQTVYLKADKPYSKQSGWGTTFTYTYSDAQTNATTWSSDIISWAYGKHAGTALHPTTEVERHRIVATGLADLPWGFMLSGKVTYGSGKPVQLFECSAGPCNFKEGRLPEYTQFDMGLSKDIKISRDQRFVIRVDVLNVFNVANYDGLGIYPWDSNYQQVTGVGGNAMRTYKLGLSYKW
jgi:hypothetical protein